MTKTEADRCRLEQIHLQITRSCNLRCYFCGQWGKKGFFSDAAGREMMLEDWERVIDEIVRFREKTGISPFIMVWGGEPLVSPYFDHLVELLHEHQFKVGMVTNGVLLDRHRDIVDKAVKKIFVSLDGPQKLHDRIRGEGVFDKLSSNLACLTGPDITVMSVVTEELSGILEEFIECLGQMNQQGCRIKEVYLQDMIGLNREEIKSYKMQMQRTFGIQAEYIDSWENDGKLTYHAQVQKELERILGKTEGRSYDFTITCKRHGGVNIPHCLSPFRHVHITWNGEVTYCTDFYDFTAGNIRRESLESIFLNEESEKFRRIIEKNQCVTCRHCSWRENREYL